MVMPKHQSAPGRLELVRAFVNTLDVDAGTDALGSTDELRTWLRDHDLVGDPAGVSESDLANALTLREALRAILLAHNDGAPVPTDAATVLDGAARRARVGLRFDETCAAALEPDSDGVDAALGRLLAIVHASIADGTWRRLKACRLDSCEWAFYDHTKNRSGVWCDMGDCGNRVKARTYRARRGTRG
jgi:predicted RNA-binding Zn ribbon-like protein